MRRVRLPEVAGGASTIREIAMAQSSPKTSLEGKRIAFVTANEGVEQAELADPWQAVKDAGGTPLLIAPKSGEVQAFRHLTPADTFTVDETTSEANADDLDAVVLPGGVANADQLRTDAPAVQLLRSMVDAGKPVAVICHGPWALIEAGVVSGRTITSWPSLETDLRNAGARWQDEQVVVDRQGPFVLVSSRKPDDIPAFNEQLVAVFAEA
jgi:protease I